MSGRLTLWTVSALAVALSAWSAGASAARISDVSHTRHNLSITGPGPVKATTESQICVFCHTPHGANVSVNAPLWNRQLSGQTYIPYSSTSIQATIDANPGGSSKLCLSCHDGTLAIGAVNVLNGQQNVTIGLTGTDAGRMPPGAGSATGFTRNLGVDLRNDHPISFTYDSALATADGELRDPAASPDIGVRGPGVRPVVPLEPRNPPGADGTVECTSCHDPHIRDDAVTSYSIKFLRLNRFQKAAPVGSAFSPSSDIVCLACHDKDRFGAEWSKSAHADPTVADEQYADAPARLREFPDSTRPGGAIRVWEAACLNCHDTHTVEGARRLLREGTDAVGTPKGAGGVSGRPAIEETCYQCHTTGAQTVLLTTNNQVPDIRSDFTQVGGSHMPITDVEQPGLGEAHDISDKDFSETRLLLGRGNPQNRHAECTDCHNPHRVMKNELFNAGGASSRGTHRHDPPPAAGHDNIASGVLRGAWGVEPVYGSASFQDLPSNYIVKSGDGGTGAATSVASTYVTREYQICLKCHSDYGYDDNNLYPLGSRPNLGDSGGGTPRGTNAMEQYTNQAKEFSAPIDHRGEGSAANPGAGSGFVANNHRGWHPVMGPTGRTLAARGNMDNFFLPPWNSRVGDLTMYCTDCHGSSVSSPTAVVPDPGRPWGPHGSSNRFILKGEWNVQTGTGQQATGLCFKCHEYARYATRGRGRSGFCCDKDDNLHSFHADKIGFMRCTWCHVAVPHGWKNKQLLVNLNDIGPEGGLPPNTEVCTDPNGDGWGTVNCSGGAAGTQNNGYTNGPYYLNAFNKVVNFKTSGNWTANDCGSSSGQTGIDWMKNNTCDNPN